MQELTIRSESVQRMYSFYREKKLIVNRRYQRKLVWSIDEKAAFIDSVLKEFPVPLFLFAEGKREEETIYEIIDGMQRLNALFSYIENEFALNGVYFDLEATAETKLLKDTGIIKQKTPLLDRKICADKIASYVLPISSYRSTDEETIDDIFRRINANGKHLSKQEIRQAGSVSLFAEAVRKISSEIRGDVSLGDRIYLNDMQRISITSRDLPYGICVDDLFWIKNGIIRREQVRESKDEEIIADILAAMIYDEMPRSSSKTLDEYYGLDGDGKKAVELDDKIRIYGYDQIHERFFTVYDEIKSLLSISGRSFIDLISRAKSFDKVPRYFQIVFLALYDLIIKKNMKIISQYEVLKVLDGITDNITLSQGGGNWSATERENSVNAVSGMLQKCFTENTEDPAIVKWSTELETILKQSEIEQTSFDFKIGFYNLSSRDFNQKGFDKSIKTLTAMANRGPDTIGYVIAGVADKEDDVLQLEQIDAKYSAFKKDDHFITGVDFDIDMSGLPADRYFQKIIQLLEQQPIDDIYRTYIGNNIRFLKYGGKNVIIFKIKGLTSAAIYGDDYYERKGANLEKIPARRISELLDKFR